MTANTKSNTKDAPASGAASDIRTQLFRALPSVDEVVHHKDVIALVAREGAAPVTEAARTVIARMREEISAGRLDERGLECVLEGVGQAVERELLKNLSYSLRPVINATGVILHTNLGRAPLSESALQHVVEAARGYSNLEFDLEQGERGKRDVHVQRLFAQLLDPEASYPVSTVVVNNCAAAVLLALNSLAEGGEVIVSRGELVEIGGSFRVPEVMAKSGATLKEVGTTNRTRIHDYEAAITDKTRLLLRVHRSNFSIVGFTEQPSLAELVDLGKRRNLPVMEDLGNGTLFDLHSIGVHHEPGVRDSLRTGVDVITYSGDKLLGGPQAGMLSGRKEIIARIRSNPMFRALRVDKLTYAALEATLLDYLRGRHQAIPTLRMMTLAGAEVMERAERMMNALMPAGMLKITISPAESIIGGGTAPTATLASYVLGVTCEGKSADELQAALRRNDPPIVARVEEGAVQLDLRTVFPEQDPQIVEALLRIAES